MPKESLRMPNENTVFLQGRLTRDPDLTYLESGTALCHFSIAHSRVWKDKDSGEKKERKLFIDVEAWGALAEWLGADLKKGRPVQVSGELKMDEWEDKNTGKRRTKIGIRAYKAQILTWGHEEESDTPKQDDKIPF